MRKGVSQPEGEVTLVFSDIEGSTKLLHELGTDAYREALTEHRRIVRTAYAHYAGYEVDYEGDAFFYVFSEAPDAVSAVSEAMTGLEEGPIRIRVGMHTGSPGLDPPKYVGMDVHFAARVMSSAHGGQVVLSKATADLVPVALTDLGEHRLKDIADPVLLFQLGEDGFPPLKTISNTNLPRPASSFVGREQELEEVLEKVEVGARLLTLTGPGGSGKTRLALEAASSLVPHYKAGVFWVGLAALRDSALVTETIAQTLGAKDGLAEHIQGRELLLLLDNLEQVVEAAPELSALLAVCPNLTLLCTSRELLRVQGEVEYQVPPLASPEAVSLLCERAQLESSEEITELCARLDNLPLAVELAAARTKALTPAQILERLSSRLDLLKGGRDADPRQQTLRATIAWSYDLLSAEEQRLFRALSVFVGGCTLEAAEEVCGADLDTLQSLVEKSLLRFTDGRYWMLETIREYAQERLESVHEMSVAGRRLADFMIALALQAEPHLDGTPDQAVWLARMEDERHNVAAALSYLQAEDPRALTRLANPVWRFWQMHGHLNEGRQWLEAALQASHEPTVTRGVTLGAAAYIAYVQGEMAAARSFAEEQLSVGRILDDSPTIAMSLHLLAHLEDADGNRAEAIALYQRSLTHNDHPRRGDSLYSLGLTTLLDGDYEAAIRWFEEAHMVNERAGDEWNLAGDLTGLGCALHGKGRDKEARAFLRRALELALPLGEPQRLATCFDAIAAVAGAEEPELAATLLGAAAALREHRDVRLGALSEQWNPRTWEVVRAHLAEDDLLRCVQDGRSLSPQSAELLVRSSVD